MSHPFFNLNHKIIPVNEPTFISANRALRYGDGIFEGLRVLNGEFIFFEDHISRLISAMSALGFSIPENFTSAFFHKLISELLIANKVSSEAIIRIQVYRASAGLYEPMTDDVEFFIETFDSVPDSFKWPGLSISAGLFSDWKKEFNPAMNFKTCNSQVYIMASRWKRNAGFDEALLLNSNGNIADATSSNIFIWKENKLITPALTEGCIAGVIRKNILAVAQTNGIETEEREVTVNEVFKAEELFLTNVSRGIRSVKSFNKQEYRNKLTGTLAEIFYSQFAV